MSLWAQLVLVPPLLSVVSFSLLATIFCVPQLLESQRAHKLQPKYPPFAKTLRRSLLWFAINSVASLMLSLLMWPIYRRTELHSGALPPWYIAVAELLFFMVLDDALFYFSHRLLHSRLLYAKVHSWHHRVFAPFSFTGALMHPIEWLIISGMILVGPIIVGAHVYVLWVWVVLRQWGNAELHSGYVGPWRVLSRLPFAGGTAHHDLHHARIAGNYASMFNWWDRWLGTELTSYDVTKKSSAAELSTSAE
jgi:4-alpha-methyl-delta7-sterol-4alpha-methyl oxidase